MEGIMIALHIVRFIVTAPVFVIENILKLLVAILTTLIFIILLFLYPITKDWQGNRFWDFIFNFGYKITYYPMTKKVYRLWSED